MKKIEDLFKSALRDQELPYDERAWNEMSKKLDSILSKVPPAVTTESNKSSISNNYSNQEKQERIVAEIPSALKKEIRRYSSSTNTLCYESRGKKSRRRVYFAGNTSLV